MEKLHGFFCLFSDLKGFLSFCDLFPPGMPSVSWIFCGGLFAVDTGNAVGEWEEYVGWEKCADGIPGECLREILQANVCLPLGLR